MTCSTVQCFLWRYKFLMEKRRCWSWVDPVYLCVVWKLACLWFGCELPSIKGTTAVGHLCLAGLSEMCRKSRSLCSKDCENLQTSSWNVSASPEWKTPLWLKVSSTTIGVPLASVSSLGKILDHSPQNIQRSQFRFEWRYEYILWNVLFKSIMYTCTHG